MKNLFLSILYGVLAISLFEFTVVEASPKDVDPYDDYVHITSSDGKHSKFVWDYGTEQNGVHEWPGVCSTGTKQSPINIMTGITKPLEGVCPFVFNSYDSIPLSFKLKNKWHSLYFWKNVEEGTRSPFLTGGALPGDDEFEFLAGHFHWASSNDKGSEHHVNNDDAPLELHLVHWNRAKGKTPQEAIDTNDWNALAVLGIKYDIGKHNKDLEPLFNAMDSIHEEGDHTYLNEKMPLKSFLPRGTGRFFRYNGSLTNPPCNEVVVWTIFKDREYISQDQMDKLRAARSSEDRRRHLENNYRPVQSQNGRVILDIDTRDYGQSCSKNHHDLANNNNLNVNSDQSTSNASNIGSGALFSYKIKLCFVAFISAFLHYKIV